MILVLVSNWSRDAVLAVEVMLQVMRGTKPLGRVRRQGPGVASAQLETWRELGQAGICSCVNKMRIWPWLCWADRVFFCVPSSPPLPRARQWRVKITSC